MSSSIIVNVLCITNRLEQRFHNHFVGLYVVVLYSFHFFFLQIHLTDLFPFRAKNEFMQFEKSA